MHLAARRVTFVFLAGMIAGATVPALAKSDRSQGRGGKKPIGQIASFDATSLALTVQLADGSSFEATVAPGAQVKLEHRGNHRRGKGHGNPTKGSLEDLVAGAKVLRMKLEDDVVTKLRIRPLPAEIGPLPAAEDHAEEPDGDATDDEDLEGEETEADDEDPDETDPEDTEDDLPPLPVPLP